MAESVNNIELQVLVCTYGAEGIARFAATNPPEVSGVEYLVSWQLPAGEQAAIPANISSRPDITIRQSDSRGLSHNRNLAMKMATAPFCLIADDDLDYGDGASFLKIIDTFKSSKADIICFKSICCGKELKPYPTRLTYHNEAPKGWYVTSFEIAYRRKSMAGSIPFNENFGIGASTILQAGEEDIWIRDAQLKGAVVMLSPVCICAHDHTTTAERHASEDWFISTHGAVMRHLHPANYPLRLIVHALRQKDVSPLRYLRLSMSAARKYRKLF
ncbi:MAG: glycosyltransferase [Muribaculaceae bacterium]|nr:glycosyltransferase [Muribaculaceae bacterium]